MDERSPTFISRLQDIRSNLLDALRMSRDLQSKLVGPRPEDPKKMGAAPTTVDSLIVEIHSLSLELEKRMSSHHETLGGFDNVAGQAVQERAYA